MCNHSLEQTEVSAQVPYSLPGFLAAESSEFAPETTQELLVETPVRRPIRIQDVPENISIISAKKIRDILNRQL